MQNIEGELEKIDANSYRISMTAAHQEDVVSDLRERIIGALRKIIESEPIIKKVDGSLDLIKQAQGIRGFLLKITKVQGKQWTKVEEYDRLVKFTADDESSQLVLKFEQTIYQMGRPIELSLETPEGYDCFSLYKHTDFSYEWRLCKIVHKEKKGRNNNLSSKKVKENDSQGDFYYWIEFLHLKHIGSSMWLKRNREEILMSARYSREQQRNFEASTLQFIVDTYDLNAGRRSNLPRGVEARRLMDEFDS